MIGHLARLFVAAIIAASTAPAAPSHPFRFADPRITEASGIAPGLRSPGVFYVQNDSGDGNRFFAVNGRTGRTAATVRVVGASNVDWEDIAVAPDSTGTPSVWLADIGDNDAVRPEVEVYRVAEPRIAATGPHRRVRLPVMQEWRLRYPDGPTDAEGLAVAPDGTAYIVTKSVGGSTVYQLPATPTPGAQELQRVGDISLAATGTGNPFGIAGQVTATGAAISADGALFVVRTYADAWVWRIGADGLAAALGTDPVVVALPRQAQGEGVAVAGDMLVVDSEGANAQVRFVALPTDVTPTGSPSAGPSGAATSGAGVDESPVSRDFGGIRAGVLVVLLVAALAVAASALRSRRRGGD